MEKICWCGAFASQARLDPRRQQKHLYQPRLRIRIDTLSLVFHARDLVLNSEISQGANKMSHHVCAVLLAGGTGSRMGSIIPKQYLQLLEKPIVSYSFELFLSMPLINEIIVVCEPEYRHLFTDYPHTKPVCFASPGARRQDSCYNGLLAASPESELICFHDAARALITEEIVSRVIQEAGQHGAASVAMPLKQTVKQINADGFVVQTLDRTYIWEAQTPQIAFKALFQEGYAHAHKRELTLTDDMAVVELTGHRIKLVPGCYTNIKITTPEDLVIAEQLLKQRSHA
jgi:2-C-methyl-D-erythritol 4-phosphate cytidylyltransferase